MPESKDAYLAGEVALWLQRACGEELEFLGCHNLTGISVPRGDSNPVYCRDGKRKYRIIRTWKGVPGLGALTIVAYAQVLNLIAELPCPPNLFALVSACGADENPDNYDFIYEFYGVELTGENIDTLVVGMSPDAETPINLTMPASFQERVKVKKLTGAARDISAITAEDVMDVAFCDSPECSDLCGDASQGCQVGFLVTRGDGGLATMLRTEDGGGEWEDLTTPFAVATDDIVAVDCDGDVVVAVNGLAAEYAYSTTGGDAFNAAIAVTRVMDDVFVLSATRIWFCGYDGYIWFSNDRGASVEIQDAGVATAQRLRMISFADARRGYAVGNNNAVVRTVDGGNIWEAIVGPCFEANDDLYAVHAIPDTKIVFVGDENGNVYRSNDGGDTWETVFASVDATAGGIADIEGEDCNTVAFIANDEDPYFYAGADVEGVMYRSLDGGNSWNLQDVPDNDGLNALDQCEVNKYWVVGEDGFVAVVAGEGI